MVLSFYFKMRSFRLAFGIVLMAAILLISADCARKHNPEAFIKHYIKLHRAGDIEGLLALHTADSEFLIPGKDPIRGTAALRDLFEWDAVLGTELVMDGIHSRGDTIFIDSIIERNNLFRALGLSEIRYKPGTRIVLRDGKIAGTYAAELDDEIQRRLAERSQTVIKWMREHRTELLKQLMPEGKIRQNGASARLILEVLADWNNSKQSSK